MSMFEPHKCEIVKVDYVYILASFVPLPLEYGFDIRTDRFFEVKENETHDFQHVLKIVATNNPDLNNVGIAKIPDSFLNIYNNYEVTDVTINFENDWLPWFKCVKDDVCQEETGSYTDAETGEVISMAGCDICHDGCVMGSRIKTPETDENWYVRINYSANRTEEYRRVKAPFTDEQIKNIEHYQKNGMFHPFTCCSEGSAERCQRIKRTGEGILIPNTEGFVCPCGEVTQDWCYQLMTEKQNDL